MAKARLRRGIERVKLANRIDALKMHEEEPDDDHADQDAYSSSSASEEKKILADSDAGSGKKGWKPLAKGAIFREVVLAKVRETKAQEEALKVEKEVYEKEAKRRSFQG
jgi:calcium/calmodulin-dependent protein kinase I